MENCNKCLRPMEPEAKPICFQCEVLDSLTDGEIGKVPEYVERILRGME